MIVDFFENEYVQTILVSILCGGIVGLEREFKSKSAGFRTLILISFGATLYTIASRQGVLSDDRIAANIVTGIGFLGAGVIYQGRFTIQGLTTAAVIWAIAAIGVLVGYGNFVLGISLAVTMVVILSLFNKIEILLSETYFTKNVQIILDNADIQSLHQFESFVDSYGIQHVRKGIEKSNNQLMAHYEFSGNRKKMRELNEAILGLKYVSTFSSL